MVPGFPAHNTLFVLFFDVVFHLLLFSISASLAPAAMKTFSKNPSFGIAEKQMIALGSKERDPNLCPAGSYQPLVL